MRRSLLAAALALTITVAACGGDDASTSDTTAAGTTAAATTSPPTTARATTTSPPTTAEATTTTAARTTAPPTTAPPTTAATTTVDVGTIVVDADTDPLRTVTVPLGTAVTLTVRSATPQEWHLHGYDLEQTGTEVVFQFTADLAGTFELESHDTETVVLELQVA